MDDEEQYIFESGGDSCALCQALNGTVDAEPIGQPHPGCGCQVRKLAKCDYTWDFSHSGTTRTGSPSGEGDYILGVDVEVTCGDGTTIGQSIQVDGHGLPSEYGDPDELWEAVACEAAAVAEALAAGCQCDDDLVA